jgi:hypothetical protein
VLFYCSGGSIPATPCASGQYALPGSRSKADCFASVFVTVVINVPIARPIFSAAQSQLQTSKEEQFASSLARAANRDPDYISLDIIQEGNDPGTTTVTSRVASADPQAAAAVIQNLDPARLQAAFAQGGVPSVSLISVQVTACLPGYELSSSQTCQLCQPKYFCPGGSSARKACAAGTYAPPGANASSQCLKAVFVLFSAQLPIPAANYTAEFQSRFRAALARTAQVPVERVALSIGSRREAEQQFTVSAEIAVDDVASAEAVRGRVDQSSLNANLVLQGLPRSTSVVATVESTGVQPSGSSTVSLPAVLGGSIGGFIVLIACSVAGFFLIRTLQRREVHSAFLNAVRNAKVGEAASDTHLPPEEDGQAAKKKGHKDVGLRVQYSAEIVLGSGSRGCVVKAAKKFAKSAAQITPVQVVAIKIVVPKQGEFDPEERRQLELEAKILNLVTARGCRSAVHAAEPAYLPQRDDACWFIMEALDGETLAAEMRRGGAPADPAVRAGACIQAARDVLAALRVLHAEGFLHCDVAPANIVHLAKGQLGAYEYTLVDFGKVRAVGESVRVEEDVSEAATGSRRRQGLALGRLGESAYRAPELISGGSLSCAADVWSLGATMLELVSGRLPSATSRLEEIQGQVFDHGLGRVIGKALEGNPEDRYKWDNYLVMRAL